MPTAGVGALSLEVIGPTADNSGERGKTAPLDVTRYPHILDVVVNVARHGSLIALRAANRALRDRCDALLAAHLVLRYFPPSPLDPKHLVPAYLSSRGGRVPALLDWNRQRLAEDRALALAEPHYIPGMTEMSPLRGDDYLSDADIDGVAIAFLPAPPCLAGARVLDLAGARDTHLAKVLAHCAPLVRTGREQDGYHALAAGRWAPRGLAVPRAVVWTHLWDWGHSGPHDYDHGPHISLLSARSLVLNLTFDPHATRNSCFIDITYADAVEDVTVIFHAESGFVGRLPSHPYMGDLPTPPPQRTLRQVVTALYCGCEMPHTFVNLSAIPASWWGQEGSWDDKRARITLHAALLERHAVDPHPRLQVDALLDRFTVLSLNEYREMVGEERFELFTG
ncbi:hypothetical protein CC85DRAFT_303752 [Cutaneotrichosporon oleaginosum]|uniref:Uncharacterized protein n=1 Tax=Cutaneotrichosporon oleaginosum TaxID=879819 RepID=A0A0J0XIE7_9TREE|nr:uncharacterized protein CC85DRAFT_303752 [Cutaneotrichosporon oleaginosum]KLT40858.1 hypothetical protein CC85DRAFT_303752 [Cutaneotrichosporon oleaginosum]TXT09282.1 hypothetical protein COLE_03216 [Cutaneotrichosporon oleaginosum]